MVYSFYDFTIALSKFLVLICAAFSVYFFYFGMVLLANEQSERDTLSVVNGKLLYICIIVRYARHQKVAQAHSYVKWAELSPNH